MSKRIAIALATLIAATPAVAQEEDGGDVSEGLNLLSEGTRLLLRGLVDEMEPALRELQGMVDDLNAYNPPEMLPNGDIIIRRKTPLEQELEPEIGEDGEVEL